MDQTIWRANQNMFGKFGRQKGKIKFEYNEIAEEITTVLENLKSALTSG